MPNIENRITALEKAANTGAPELIAFSWVPPVSGLASFTHDGKRYQQPPEQHRDGWLDHVKAEISAKSPGRAFVWLDYDDQGATI